MTRIQPECFIQFFKYVENSYMFQVYPISKVGLAEHNDATYALFKIKPQSSTLAERLEARKVNNNLK